MLTVPQSPPPEPALGPLAGPPPDPSEKLGSFIVRLPSTVAVSTLSAPVDRRSVNEPPCGVLRWTTRVAGTPASSARRKQVNGAVSNAAFGSLARFTVPQSPPATAAAVVG